MKCICWGDLERRFTAAAAAAAVSPRLADATAPEKRQLRFDTDQNLHFLVSVREREAESWDSGLYSSLKIAPVWPNGSQRRFAPRANHNRQDESTLAQHWPGVVW